jgi:predicted O-linked N-acetylglucosamine transferase (SPINDLY family)
VGVLYPSSTDKAITDCFDECIDPPKVDFISSVRTVASEITARRPALIFYPSVGMVSQVIALAALRLAPIQCVSYGHMATTMSPVIDYIIFPEDFVGATHCFSEKILALPKAAMPFAPWPTADSRRHASDGMIRVAIPASTMKLNPVLFDTIARIDAGAKTQVEFQFFPLAAVGLAFFELSRIVGAGIRRGTVFPQMPHDRYMERLAQCDLFLCPFPYGNTNGIVDTFQLGLPGICLDGEEAHAHTDAALFARIGLPAELSAQSIDEYIAAAIKLIDDEGWRQSCTDIVRKADLGDAFFSGDPDLFAAAIENLIWPYAC